MARQPKTAYRKGVALAGPIEITGISELQQALDEVVPNVTLNLMRGVVHGIAQDVAKRARDRAPRGSTGTLKRAIKAKRGNQRNNGGKPFSDVGVEHGYGAKDDAFYWRFLEYGTQSHVQPKLGGRQHPGTSESGFMRKAIESVRPEIPSIMETQFRKKFQALLKRQEKKAQKRAKG